MLWDVKLVRYTGLCLGETNEDILSAQIYKDNTFIIVNDFVFWLWNDGSEQ